MFYTKYGLIAFYLSYLFPPEASTVIVKHLKKLNDYDLSRVFYIKKSNLTKFIPYQYVINSSLHCRLSSCPPRVIYSSIYKNNHYINLSKELARVFSRNFENTSQILTYIHNNKRIFDFDTGLYNLYMNFNTYNTHIINSFNYHHYQDVLHYETKSSRYQKYFVKDDHYHHNLKYREFYHSHKIKNKQFKQSIKNIHYNKTAKRGFRRNY